MKQITLTFRPQAWRNDDAIDVDPIGETTATVPAVAVEGIRMATYESDNLRHRPDVPAWWAEWCGPFEIEWEDEA